MTIEEAIKTLKEHKIMFQHDFGWDISTIKALEIAIKALEQEPCEDAVSRQAVLKLPRKTLKNYFGEVVGDVIYVRDVMELPPVTPKENCGERMVSE